MTIQKDNFYVITGGPGTGKTSLLDALHKRGYAIVPEVARAIIRTQIQDSGDALPWKDTRQFSQLMLAHSIRDFKALDQTTALYFFDRGIPDTYGYEILMGFDYNETLQEALRTYRYNTKVFLLPFWQEIYTTDNERKQDLQEAEHTYHALHRAYEGAGYTAIEVPRGTVEERAGFVLSQVDNFTT